MWSSIAARPLLQCTDGSSGSPRPGQVRVRRELLTNTCHHPRRIPTVSTSAVTYPTVIEEMGEQHKSTEHCGLEGLAENCEFEVPLQWAAGVEKVNEAVQKVLDVVLAHEAGVCDVQEKNL
ncbi:unnamed protein product [Calypogeia fissa]